MWFFSTNWMLRFMWKYYNSFNVWQAWAPIWLWLGKQRVMEFDPKKLAKMLQSFKIQKLHLFSSVYSMLSKIQMLLTKHPFHYCQLTGSKGTILTFNFYRISCQSLFCVIWVLTHKAVCTLEEKRLRGSKHYILSTLGLSQWATTWWRLNTCWMIFLYLHPLNIARGAQVVD